MPRPAETFSNIAVPLHHRGASGGIPAPARPCEPRPMPKFDQAGRNSTPSTGSGPAGGFAPLGPEPDVTDLAASLRFWCGLLGFALA